MPAVYTGSHTTFVDGIFAAFVLAAFRIGLDALRPCEWAVFGLFCGFAFGTKYTALLAIPAIAVSLSLARWKEFRANQFSRGMVGIVLALAVAALVSAPYYIRNWLLLGCPICPPPPGYAAFCSPKYLPAETIASFHAYVRQRGAGMGRSLGAFLLLPFHLTYYTSLFHGAGGIGLCPLALGPIGFLAFRKNHFARALALFLFLVVVLWFVTQQESRFLIHVYVMSAVFAVLGWRTVVSSQRRGAYVLVTTVLAVSFSYGLLMMYRERLNDARAVLSARWADFRHQTTIPYLQSFDYLNRDTSVRRVLILDRSVPPFYSDRDYVKPVGQWGEHTLPGAPDGRQALEEALRRQLEVSHVLDVHSPYAPFQIAPDTPGLTLVFEAPDQRVYRVD